MRPRGWENETDVTELFSGPIIVNVRRMPITLSESINNELFLMAKSCSNVDFVRNKCWMAFSCCRNLPWRSAMPAWRSWTSWINLDEQEKQRILKRWTNELTRPVHGWISACFDVRSSCTCFKTCLSNLQECFFIGDSFFQKFNILLNIKDFLKNLNKRKTSWNHFRLILQTFSKCAWILFFATCSSCTRFSNEIFTWFHCDHISLLLVAISWLLELSNSSDWEISLNARRIFSSV